jgi:hypothetical protein
MSVQKLVMKNEKPIGYTYADEPIYAIGPSIYFQSKYSCSPSVLSLSNGSTTSWVLQPARDDRYIIRDAVLRYSCTNASATETCRFYNPFLMLSQVKLLINNVEVVYYQTHIEIMSAVARQLKKYPADQVYNILASFRNNTTTSFTPDQYTAASTTNHQLPLKLLFPDLEGLIVNLSGTARIEVQFTFASNSNSAPLNNMFCQSNTTSNAYDGDLTYSNLEVDVKYVRPTDARAYASLGNYIMPTRKFLVKRLDNIAWNVVGTNNFTINLSNDFAKSNMIEQLSVFFYDVAGNSAYNSAAACRYYGGVKYASFVMRSRSNIVLDLKDVVRDEHNRKEYEMMVYKNRNGVDEPLELLNETTLLGQYLIPDTLTVDLSNVIEDDQSPSQGYSGRNNNENDVEVTFTCASAISANVIAFCVLHTCEIAVIDSKTGSVKKIQ